MDWFRDMVLIFDADLNSVSAFFQLDLIVGEILVDHSVQIVLWSGDADEFHFFDHKAYPLF